MEEAFNFIEKNVKLSKDDYVVIALSGGPDSMALLSLLIRYRDKKSFNIICAHVHHNIRKESDEEAIFVEKYCKDNNVIFEMKKLSYDVKFTESLGHKMRYDFFEDIVKKYNAKYLFTAHHGDDLIETILMKIVRGASVLGYSGFDFISVKESYSIIRPLYCVTKADIINYLNENNIPYVIDKSNFDDSYTRNRYRKYILPKLKEEDSDVHLKFIQFSEQLKEYDNYFEKKANEYIESYFVDNKLNLDNIKNLEKPILNKIIYKFLMKYYNSENDINKKHIDSIYKIIHNQKPNIIIDIPNYKVIKEYNKITISNVIDTDNYEYILNDEVILPNGKKIIIVNTSNLNSNFVTYLDSSKIKLPLHVRNFRQGDEMTIKNMVGHKKIKDIFINEKIDYTSRKTYPVVLDANNEIIWLPGIKKSLFDSKNSEKYDIILEYR